jgi:transposase-like protein
LETVAKRPRRVFSAADKVRIVTEADRCLASGKRGDLEALLRREGIYSSLLSSWRTQLGANGAAGLSPRKPGRKPKLTAAERRNAELMKRNTELERKLHVASVLIALQKNSRARCSTACWPETPFSGTLTPSERSGRQLFGASSP